MYASMPAISTFGRRICSHATTDTADTLHRLSPVSIQTQAPANRNAQSFLAVFIYATHATQAIAFGWKPGFNSESTCYSSQGFRDHKHRGRFCSSLLE